MSYISTLPNGKRNYLEPGGARIAGNEDKQRGEYGNY